MSKKQKLGGLGVLVIVILGLLTWHLHDSTVAILEPRGTIGSQEKHLIIIAVLLSLVVVIPVYAMLIGFSLKYREGNKNARYEPSFDHSRAIETVWWGVPIVLITILGVITWHSSHQLDPFKPLSSKKTPLKIQVIALQWKWLFIYPKQNVASVNYAEIPINTPVRFEITSDAPMNSFWVPQLGGQIYAMSGMATNLNLEAGQAGSYHGTSANISGDGFSGMDFIIKANSRPVFDTWVGSMKKNHNDLSAIAYRQLSAPSQNTPVKYYSSADSGLFNSVVDKFLAPVYIKPPESQ
jgi:cytochrome o ubiquinol oxidase subunit II